MSGERAYARGLQFSRLAVHASCPGQQPGCPRQHRISRGTGGKLGGSNPRLCRSDARARKIGARRILGALLGLGQTRPVVRSGHQAQVVCAGSANGDLNDGIHNDDSFQRPNARRENNAATAIASLDPGATAGLVRPSCVYPIRRRDVVFFRGNSRPFARVHCTGTCTEFDATRWRPSFSFVDRTRSVTSS
jgi:hypothetical protein